MTESLYQYVLNQLSLTKGDWPNVALGTGISYRTLEKIARQEIKDPGVSHIEKLAGYFRGQAKRPTHVS
jgi:hypothetical protein